MEYIPPKSIEDEFVIDLARDVNEWIKKRFKGWLPPLDREEFNQWAERYRLGDLGRDEFWGLVTGQQEKE